MIVKDLTTYIQIKLRLIILKRIIRDFMINELIKKYKRGLSKLKTIIRNINYERNKNFSKAVKDFYKARTAY